MKKTTVQRALQHLNVFADEIITAFHDGTYTGVVAKLKLQHEIAVTLQDLYPNAFEDRLWLRIQLPHKPTALAQVLDVLRLRVKKVYSANYAGPRSEDSPAVLYVVAQAPYEAVSLLLDDLSTLNFPVRDWKYGCIRRDAA